MIEINYDEKIYFENSGLKKYLTECGLLEGAAKFDKVVYPPNFSVDPENLEPFPPRVG